MRRMRFLTWPVVPTLGAVALCVGALEGQSQDGAAASGRVAGRVVDASQGTPLVGVSVGIPGTSLQAYTGVDGRYLLVGVPAGSVDVVFRRIGGVCVSLLSVCA
jgi:hypothetical protein